MKHVWSILCKKSIIDSETNNITIQESLEEIIFSIPVNQELKLPANFPFDFEIVSFWTRENSKGEDYFYMEVDLVDPDKKTITNFKQRIIFPENKRKLRTRIKNSFLPVTKEGEYVFKIRTKEKKNDKFKILTEIPVIVAIKIIMPNK